MGQDIEGDAGGRRYSDATAAAALAAAVDLCMVLPEGCIANVLSLTSPRDACRLSLVASTFRSAAESDAVWERFLPADYKEIIARAVDPPSPPLLLASKRQLYLRLSDHPLIIDDGTKSFSLDKWSGRKCFMLAARDLSIVWGDTPRYWRWISHPDSRFLEVAELASVCWLEIRGKINTSMLSPDTSYAAYFVFKSTPGTYGFEYQPAEAMVGISGGESETRTVYLDPEGMQRQQYQLAPRRIGRGLLYRNFTSVNMWRPRETTVPRENDARYPKARGDGWIEVEMGEYFNEAGREDSELEVSLLEVKGGDWKSGIIVQGIEIRPKGECK